MGVWESGTHYIRAPAKSTTRASTPKPRARGPPPPSTHHVRNDTGRFGLRKLLHVRFFLERQGRIQIVKLKYDRVEFGIEHLCPRSTAKLSHTENRTAPTPRAPACIASLDELEPRPLYSEPELCGGRVEGDEQLAHRD